MTPCVDNGTSITRTIITFTYNLKLCLVRLINETPPKAGVKGDGRGVCPEPPKGVVSHVIESLRGFPHACGSSRYVARAGLEEVEILRSTQRTVGIL